jgi:hypothetical protein
MVARAWRRNCVGVGGLGVSGLVLVVFLQLSTVGVPSAEGGASEGAVGTPLCWEQPGARGCKDSFRAAARADVLGACGNMHMAGCGACTTAAYRPLSAPTLTSQSAARAAARERHS